MQDGVKEACQTHSNYQLIKSNKMEFLITYAISMVILKTGIACDTSFSS